jgi:hypothetical protein
VGSVAKCDASQPSVPDFGWGRRCCPKCELVKEGK